jgi:hypothetical protein
LIFRDLSCIILACIICLSTLFTHRSKYANIAS